MSVIIKSWEMPKNCGECILRMSCNDTPLRIKEAFKAGLFLKRPEFCPLVELPEKHGRLIDADAIDYDDYWCNKHYSIRDCQQAQILIEEQPTVLESEE